MKGVGFLNSQRTTLFHWFSLREREREHGGRDKPGARDAGLPPSVHTLARREG